MPDSPEPNPAIPDTIVQCDTCETWTSSVVDSSCPTEGCEGNLSSEPTTQEASGGTTNEGGGEPPMTNGTH
uniref:Uncharacterized protein n=1 Tax=Bionectria ochroleuca TaxID=29856 RepID=A0A0B7JR62_BIOOC